MTLQEKQAELIEDLNLIENVQERLAVLNSYIPRVALPEAERSDALLVPGCVSRVWVLGEFREGRCHFRCAADSPMVAGLVALLCHLYTDSEPAEVIAVEPEIWAGCMFHKVLSPTRMNGLAAVRTRLREFAEASIGSTGA
ncbi:cysteine desulfuration protein SufE [Prosthecobacter fusiformis]|uniref:Cysteine desulfuration protein SufE n=1 Tax=Prosthecobacter fusiformis TaxID=48464 RepID=A0A4R7SQC2_9BACT|nr:SufE family protein [Prosthecobacter fusiformis]TDU81164.1 cysteine desulfuration protein SufE [Prosthecobacter fusiformis]